MKATELRHAWNFFREHAGYVVGRRAQGALELARAENYARAQGWSVSWESDDCAWGGTEEEGRNPSECEIALLHDDDGSILGSLGCVHGADAAYRRTVAAELALEAMGERETEGARSAWAARQNIATV